MFISHFFQLVVFLDVNRRRFSKEEIVSQQDQISKFIRSPMTVIDLYAFHPVEN